MTKCNKCFRYLGDGLDGCFCEPEKVVSGKVDFGGFTVWPHGKDLHGEDWWIGPIPEGWLLIPVEKHADGRPIHKPFPKNKGLKWASSTPCWVNYLGDDTIYLGLHPFIYLPE